MLKDKSTLVKISIRLASQSLDISGVSESVHSFDYEFMQAASKYGFSATQNSEVLLSVLSSLGFNGENLDQSESYILTSWPIRPSNEQFWSPEVSTKGGFTQSRHDKQF